MSAWLKGKDKTGGLLPNISIILQMPTIIGICITDSWKGFRYVFQHQNMMKNNNPWFSWSACPWAYRQQLWIDVNTKLNVLSPIMSPQRRSLRLMRLSKRQDDAMIEGNVVVEILEAAVSPLTSDQTKSTASKKYSQRQYVCNWWSCAIMCSNRSKKQLEGKQMH